MRVDKLKQLLENYSDDEQIVMGNFWFESEIMEIVKNIQKEK